MSDSQWVALLDNPERFDGRKVRLEGMVVGSFIERMGSEPGVQTVISPHPSRSGLAPMVDDMDSKVIVFLPGDFSDAQLQSLQLVKMHGGCLEVEGEFEYKPKDDGYIGRMNADSYENN